MGQVDPVQAVLGNPLTEVAVEELEETANGFVPELVPVKEGAFRDDRYTEYTTDFVDKLFEMSRGGTQPQVPDWVAGCPTLSPKEFGEINATVVSGAYKIDADQDPLYKVAQRLLKRSEGNNAEPKVDPREAYLENWDSILWDGFNTEEVFDFLLLRKARVAIVEETNSAEVPRLALYDYNFSPALKFDIERNSTLLTKNGLVAMLTQYDASQLELAANSTLFISI